MPAATLGENGYGRSCAIGRKRTTPIANTLVVCNNGLTSGEVRHSRIGVVNHIPAGCEGTFLALIAKTLLHSQASISATQCDGLHASRTDDDGVSLSFPLRILTFAKAMFSLLMHADNSTSTLRNADV